VYDEDAAVLTEICSRIFTDQILRDNVRHAQEKNFPLDGGSAERVRAEIRKFI